jgi:predicted HD superfamily hydrolase involved in NAD metabolism
MHFYEDVVKKRLTRKRYLHSLAVRDCAVELAELYTANCTEAELAGLLHDFAREIPGPELLHLAEVKGLTVGAVDRQFPLLLHGPVGAVLVREELGIENPRVLDAIALHTLGGVEMDELAKIVYVADLIAPGRSFPCLDELRQVARQDLDRALLECLASTIRYCLERQCPIHPQTIAAWNFYTGLRS